MRAEAGQSVTAGVAPGGAQSSRCPRRSRKHPFGLGAEGLRRREGLLPGCRLQPPPPGFREVSLVQGVREANSQVVPEEKLPG